MRVLCALLIVFQLSWSLHADEAKPVATPRFAAYDLVIDSGSEQLTAYQVNITYAAEDKIVGVEGGRPAGFGEAPFYDRDALRGGVIILAAFVPRDELAVAGRQIIARIHIAHISTESPAAEVMVLAGLDGKEISGDITLIPVTTKRSQP